MYPGFGPQKIEMNKRTGSAVPSDEYNAMKTALEKQAQVGAGMSLEGNSQCKVWQCKLSWSNPRIGTRR